MDLYQPPKPAIIRASELPKSLADQRGIQVVRNYADRHGVSFDEAAQIIFVQRKKNSGTPGIFVGQHILTTGTLSFPAGTQEGDLVLICHNQSTSTGVTISASGYNVAAAETLWSTGSGYYRTCRWKILTSTDIATPGTLSTIGSYGMVSLQVFRNVTTVTHKELAASLSGATIPLSGFTKAVGSKFVVSVAYERDAANTLALSGFTLVQAPSNGVFTHAAAYLDSASYTNGTAVTWSTTAGNSYQQGADLFEIT